MEYQYSVNNCGVKENIVLNEKPETNIFEYKIETKNLYLKKQENDKVCWCMTKIQIKS